MFYPLKAVYEIISVPALYAEVAMVNRCIICRRDFNDLALFYIKVKVAARAAVAAGSPDLFKFKGPSLASSLFIGQRACRTGRDTLAAELAVF